MSRVVKSKPKKSAEGTVSGLTQLLSSPSGRSFLRVSLKAELTTADSVAPPGSIVDCVVRSLRDKTDLPPMLGVTALMSTVSAAMCQAGSTVTWPGDSHHIELNLWLLVLAPSGAGKTYLRNLIVEACGLSIDQLPEPASAAVFIDSLFKLGGRAQWVRDEYGHLLKLLRENNSKGELRDVLLRAYDYSALVNNTRKHGEIRVEKPVVSLYATTVDATFGDCVDVQMLSDGFCARHLFVVCDSRPIHTPRYPRNELLAEFHASARGLAARLEKKTHFQISDEADRLYRKLWHSLVAELSEKLDAAYIRRITWSAARYAAIYHVLLNRPGTVIGEEAMHWAWRMVLVHCHSTRLALALTDRTLAGRIERISCMVNAAISEGVDVSSKQFARRVIQTFKRDLGSITEARQIIELVRP